MNGYCNHFPVGCTIVPVFHFSYTPGNSSHLNVNYVIVFSIICIKLLSSYQWFFLFLHHPIVAVIIPVLICTWKLHVYIPTTILNLSKKHLINSFSNPFLNGIFYYVIIRAPNVLNLEVLKGSKWFVKSKQKEKENKAIIILRFTWFSFNQTYIHRRGERI